MYLQLKYLTEVSLEWSNAWDFLWGWANRQPCVMSPSSHPLPYRPNVLQWSQLVNLAFVTTSTSTYIRLSGMEFALSYNSHFVLQLLVGDTSKALQSPLEFWLWETKLPKPRRQTAWFWFYIVQRIEKELCTKIPKGWEVGGEGVAHAALLVTACLTIWRGLDLAMHLQCCKIVISFVCLLFWCYIKLAQLCIFSSERKLFFNGQLLNIQ